MNIEIVPKEYITKLNYHDALLYCSMMNIDGKDDWKLPTFAEYRHISPMIKRNILGMDIKSNQMWVDFMGTSEIPCAYDLYDNTIHPVLNPNGEHYVCPIRYD